MTDSEDTRKGLTDALQAVRDALLGLQADMKRMPFFVRPMAQKGIERRTGRSIQAWLRLVAEVTSTANQGASGVVAQWPRLPADLERLADNFRTAPERASRMMGGAAMKKLERDSADRARAVTRAIIALQDLG